MLGTAALTLISVNTFFALPSQYPLAVTRRHYRSFVSRDRFNDDSPSAGAIFSFYSEYSRSLEAGFNGAMVVVGLLYKLLSFVYVQRVVDTKSLYGSVGILIVLMLGLSHILAANFTRCSAYLCATKRELPNQ